MIFVLCWAWLPAICWPNFSLEAHLAQRFCSTCREKPCVWYHVAVWSLNWATFLHIWNKKKRYKSRNFPIVQIPVFSKAYWACFQNLFPCGTQKQTIWSLRTMLPWINWNFFFPLILLKCTLNFTYRNYLKTNTAQSLVSLLTQFMAVSGVPLTSLSNKGINEGKAILTLSEPKALY